LHQQKTFFLAAGGRPVGRQEVSGTKPGFLSVVFLLKAAAAGGGKEGKVAKLGILGSMTFLQKVYIKKKVTEVDCVFLLRAPLAGVTSPLKAELGGSLFSFIFELWHRWIAGPNQQGNEIESSNMWY
jgi:hypothetical protein